MILSDYSAIGFPVPRPRIRAASPVTAWWLPPLPALVVRPPSGLATPPPGRAFVLPQPARPSPSAPVMAPVQMIQEAYSTKLAKEAAAAAPIEQPVVMQPATQESQGVSTELLASASEGGGEEVESAPEMSAPVPISAPPPAIIDQPKVQPKVPAKGSLWPALIGAGTGFLVGGPVGAAAGGAAGYFLGKKKAGK